MTHDQPDRPFSVRVAICAAQREAASQATQSPGEELWTVANEVRNAFGADLDVSIEGETEEADRGKKGLADIESILILLGTGVLAVQPVLNFIVELVRELGACRRGKIKIKTLGAEFEYEGERPLDELRSAIEYAVERRADVTGGPRQDEAEVRIVDVEITVPYED